MFLSREQVFSALFDLLCATVPPPSIGTAWNTKSRDMRSWDEVIAADQPALFLSQSPQHATMDTFGLLQWKLGAAVIIYYKTDGITNSAVACDTAANELIDVFEAAMAPIPGQLQTLAPAPSPGFPNPPGLVLHAYIDGTVAFDSGLTDTQAVVVIPITILVGALGT